MRPVNSRIDYFTAHVSNHCTKKSIQIHTWSFAGVFIIRMLSHVGKYNCDCNLILGFIDGFSNSLKLCDASSNNKVLGN